MLEHYLGVKEQYPDALLFYRMGDFYELFFEDAEVAARELQIALTSRDRTAESKTPMCGVPHHAVENYLAQLVDKGFKVAVCDQVEDPKEAKGLVRREVTRVLTPGTVTEDANLSAKTNNYLAALCWNADKGRGGLTWLDFSTGTWAGMGSNRETELWQWAMKVAPRELLLPKGLAPPTRQTDLAAHITELPPRPAFDPERAARAMAEAQHVEDVSVLGLGGEPELLRACGAVLHYLGQTQLGGFDHLGEFNLVNLGRHLVLDEVTERNLEIFRRLDGRTGRGTLWKVLDATMTPMGGRLLEQRLKTPWREPGPILRTQECVAFLHGRDGLRAALRELLDSVYDLERLSTRVALGRATPKDYLALRRSAQNLGPIRGLLAAEEQSSQGLAQGMARLLGKWDGLDDIRALLEAALVDSPPPVITEGGLFRPGYDARLDELIGLTEHGESALQSLLEREQAATDIPKLKLGFNKVFGYYIEISKLHQDKVPEHFIRRQTLVNCERYITEELKELEEKLLSAAQDRRNLEYELFAGLRARVAEARPRFMFMAHALAALDYWQCLAETARTRSWCAPEIAETIELEIEAGRHPVVEDAQGANYIPSDLRMDESRRILLITGPNMAGKSTVLRQAAILTILAQIGSFVPARRARIGLADR
ncbi:MAG: DNA mismatch repair protein MutS, partial [Desulfovibrionaceae bacterium]